jgi:hypothetical protein
MTVKFSRREITGYIEEKQCGAIGCQNPASAWIRQVNGSGKSYPACENCRKLFAARCDLETQPISNRLVESSAVA